MKVTCILACISASSLLLSCSPKFYAPQGQNVPLFSKKGDVALAAGYSSIPSETAGGFHFQRAKAITDNVGVTTSFYNVISGANEDWDVNGKVFEVGAGYYSSFGERWVFETYGGIGLGSFLNDSRTDNQNYDVRFTKPFLQPAIGFTHKHFDIAFASRLALVNFTKHSGNVSSEDRPLVNDFFNEKGTTFVIEPGLTMRGGSETVKAQVQYVYSSFSYDSGEFSPVLSDYISVGLIIELSGKKGETE